MSQGEAPIAAPVRLRADVLRHEGLFSITNLENGNKSLATRKWRMADAAAASGGASDVDEADRADRITMLSAPGEPEVFDARVDGVEYAGWDERSCPLGSAVSGGLDDIVVSPGVSVLALGAGGSGVSTVRHLSNIVGPRGRVYAVDFFAEAGKRLEKLAEQQPNVVPISSDARKPENYANLVTDVEVVWCAVPQPDMARILAINAERFLMPGGGFLISICATEIDITREPESVFAGVVSGLRGVGFRPREQLVIDHFANTAVVRGNYREAEPAIKPAEKR
jgi:rRNA 2'-O-methyltransferase fibrillarin